MKKKKNELYSIVAIMSVVFLVVIIYISYSVFGQGTLVFWIKNYNPPCGSNNITQCEKEAFRFDKILIDNNQVSGNKTIYGGQLWKIELKLTAGSHSVKIIQENGSITMYDLKIETNKEKCYRFSWWSNLTIHMDYPDGNACPP
jgi:hypothetical protein